jgi:hypothetical protein
LKDRAKEVGLNIRVEKTKAMVKIGELKNKAKHGQLKIMTLKWFELEIFVD